MSQGSIANLIILSSFETELSAIADICTYQTSYFEKTINALKGQFPNASEYDIIKILSLLIELHNKNNNEKIDLVITAPLSFKIKARLTEDVISNMLNNSKNSIILTGYSVSDYIDEYIDLIIRKSQSGVFVKLFFNNLEKQEHIEKIIRYTGKFLKIYNYKNEDDEMSAMHAKMLSIDGKQTLISSANLSYHGMSGNIELGCFVESGKIAKQIDDIFKQLIIDRVFVEIKKKK